VLYVTTVQNSGMSINSDHPLSGALFAITGLGVRGVNEGVFGASERGTLNEAADGNQRAIRARDRL
jgi:hypothetical protein